PPLFALGHSPQDRACKRGMQSMTCCVLDIRNARAILAKHNTRLGGHRAMSDYQVGFIAIANMGWPMAKNILNAGDNVLKSAHKLAVCDLDKARVGKFVQEEQNAVAAASAAELAKGSNVVITMLPTGPIVRDVVEGLLAAGALQSGTIVIDMSSSEPVGTK